MSEQYFVRRASECEHLANQERDPDLRSMLRDLEHDYRMQAQRAMGPYRAH